MSKSLDVQNEENDPQEAPVMLDPKEAFEGLVQAVSDKCGWKLSTDGDITTLLLDTGGDRTQKVMITADIDIAGQGIARYWSVVGSARSGLLTERV